MHVSNAELKDGFTQVVVWPGTLVGDDCVDDFLVWMTEEFGVRAQYLEEIETNPSRDNYGNIIEGTGGRNDLLFAVHAEDVPKFVLPRLKFGMRWLEDVLEYRSLSVQDPLLYPERVLEYCTWGDWVDMPWASDADDVEGCEYS
jgi:hypothetical protein